MPARIPVPSQEKLEEMYIQQEMTSTDIAAHFDVSQGTAWKWLHDAGIEMRRGGRRLYDIEGVLEFLGTPSPALWYVIGFAFADGCLSSSPNSVFVLSNKDRGILDHMAVAMQYPARAQWSSSGVYTLIIRGKAIFGRLCEFGLAPRKSLVMQWPKIPRLYLGDFVRGYFDGDGTVQFQNLRGLSPSIYTTFTSGSLAFLDGLRRALGEVGVTPAYIYHGPKGYPILSITHRDANLAMVKLMYGNDPLLYLERKWRRYAMFLAWSGFVRPSLATAISAVHIPRATRQSIQQSHLNCLASK